MSTKTTKKRPHTKSRNKKNIKKTKNPLIPFLFIFLFALLASTASYFLLFKNSSNKNINEASAKVESKIKKPEELTKDNIISSVKNDDKLPKYQFEEITKEFNVDYETHPKVEHNDDKKEEQLKEKTNIEKKVFPDKEILIKTEKVYENKQKELENTLLSSKPKLAIIIDDITTSYQIKKAKEIGYTVNLAFLPPTKVHPNSANIAQDVENHMIHLPLEASPNFTSQEKDVLNTSDSYEIIEKRIKHLRELYPKVIYTNNHTGSVFTENDNAMDNLYKALKKYNFIFVDSRTSPNSVAKKYAEKYAMPFYVRNTFIDNNKDKTYIKNQLLKAVTLAKKNGFAIAIGHPYKETFEVLKNSQEILEEIQTVFVHQL